MATHSSILAWRIPWTEEPGGLQSVRPVEKSWTQLKRLMHAYTLKYGFFCSKVWVRDVSMLHVSSSPFSLLYHSLLSEYTKIYFSIMLLIGSWVVACSGYDSAAMNILWPVLWQTYALISPGYVTRSAVVVTAAIWQQWIWQNICFLIRLSYVLSNASLPN